VIVSASNSVLGDAAFETRINDFGAALDAAQAAANGGEGLQIISGTLRDYDFRVSDDGTTALASINIFEDLNSHILLLTHVAEDFTDDEYEFLMVGSASINVTFGELAESDLFTGGSIGIGVAIIILALIFGTVVAAFIPILLAIIAVVTAIGMSTIIGQFAELNEFIPNIITMMGVAVGIDYSLFVLSRYKEDRAKGLDKQASH
jgi:RND superfamily putative drug exporter